MRILIMAIITIFCLNFSLFAKEGETKKSKLNRIKVTDVFFGKTYKVNVEYINIYNMGFIHSIKDDIASSELTKARILFWTAMPLAIVGGAMIGYPIGTKLGGGEFNTPIFGVGVGIGIITIILGHLSNNAVVKSVSRYNSVLKDKYNITIKDIPKHYKLRNYP